MGGGEGPVLRGRYFIMKAFHLSNYVFFQILFQSIFVCSSGISGLTLNDTNIYFYTLPQTFSPLVVFFGFVFKGNFFTPFIFFQISVLPIYLVFNPTHFLSKRSCSIDNLKCFIDKCIFFFLRGF